MEDGVDLNNASSVLDKISHTDKSRKLDLECLTCRYLRMFDWINNGNTSTRYLRLVYL